MKSNIKDILFLDNEKDTFKITVNKIFNKQIYIWVDKISGKNWFETLKKLKRNELINELKNMEEKINEHIFKNSNFTNYKFRWILINRMETAFEFWFEDINKPHIPIPSNDFKEILLNDTSSREEMQFNILKKLSKNEKFKKVMTDFEQS